MSFQCYCCVFLSVYCERKVLRLIHNFFRPMKHSYTVNKFKFKCLWKSFPNALISRCSFSYTYPHSSTHQKCQHVCIMQSDAQTVKEGKSPFGLSPHMYISKGALSAHTKLVLHSEEHVCTLMLKITNNHCFLAKRHQL